MIYGEYKVLVVDGAGETMRALAKHLPTGELKYVNVRSLNPNLDNERS